MSNLGYDPERPSATKVLGLKIDALRVRARSERRIAAIEIGAGATVTVLTLAGVFPPEAGAPIVGLAAGVGYKSSAESRDSANEASQLLAVHQQSMYEEQRARELGQGESFDEPPEQPQ